MDDKVIKTYEQVLKGEIKKFPYGFWSKRKGIRVNTIICVKYLIEEVLKWTDEDIKDNFTIKTLREYKLYGMLEHYNNSIYRLINDVYPNKFYPWELKCVPMGYWEKKINRLFALSWLYEKLKINKKNIKRRFCSNNFRKYGLGALLESKYNNSPYLALNELFPNKYKPWEVSNVGRGYWQNKSNCQKATIWLINLLDLADDELNEKLTKEDFEKNGLGSMLKISYKDSPYLAIYDILPQEKKRAI